MQKRPVTATPKTMESFPILLTAVFASLELVNIFHHAMWRDELQVWMIARHSHSIIELISLKKYEGHPDAWFLLVYLITKFTTHPVWMQIVHAAVASITTYIIGRFSPFTRIQKTLIVFGYFFFFEYATVSREYALAVLVLFAFCALFRSGLQKNYLVLALILGLLSQTSIYSVIITLALVAALIFEIIRTPSWRESLIPKWRQLTLATVIVTISIAVAVLHIRPPPDGGYVTHLDFGSKGFLNSFGMFWKSFVPVPNRIPGFHNSNIIQTSGIIPSVDQPRVMAFLGVIIFCFSALFFIRKPVVLFAYCCGVAELLCFKHIVYAGAIWHDGFAFMLFLSCLWLSSSFPDKPSHLQSIKRLDRWFAPLRSRGFFLILSIQTAAGVAVSIAAFKIPFSQARAVADYVRAHKMERWPIVGDRDFAVSPIAGYLDRDIYYCAGNRMGSFVIWDKKRKTDVSSSVMPEAAKMATELHQNVLLILSNADYRVGQSVGEIASFQGAIEGDENYHLYVIRPIQSSGSDSGAKILKAD